MTGQKGLTKKNCKSYFKNISNGARMKIIFKCWNKHGADQKNNGKLSRDAHPKPVRKPHALA